MHRSRRLSQFFRYRASMARRQHIPWLPRTKETSCDPKQKARHGRSSLSRGYVGTPTAFRAVLLGSSRSATVEVFSPQGTVKDVRQVAVRFSEPMVAFGDPRLPEPFDIDCAARGRGRWADTRNWVYDFESNLPAGLVCRFTLREGLKSVAGGAVTGRRQYSFDTGGPSIRASLPMEGDYGIDAEQVFVLALDASATPVSIAEHAACAIENVAERIPVDVLDGQGPRGSAGAAPPAGLPVPAAIWRVIGRIPQRRCAHGDQSTGIRAHRASLPPFASAGHQGQPDLGPRHRDRERTGNTRRPGARLPHPSRLQRADGVRACQCKRALPADAPGANRLLVAGPIRAGAADQGHGRVRPRIRARERRGRAFAAGGNAPLRRAIPGARRAHDHARGWAQGRRRSRTRQRR